MASRISNTLRCFSTAGTCLVLALGAQDLHEAGVEVDCSHGVAALAVRGDYVVAQGGGELHHPDDAGSQVDVAPAQPDQLADAQPRAEQERSHRVGPVVLHQGQELPGLFG